MDRNGTRIDMAASAAVSALPSELERIFEQHQQRVYRAAYRVTGNAADAEDVLQTVFLRLMRRSAGAEPIDKLATYLHRAALNAALDIVRQRPALQDVPLEDAGPALIDDPRRQPDRRQDARELRAVLRRALAQLPPKAAEIFALRYFEGYDNPEIAAMLGLSYADVAATLHRARRRLGEQMRSYLGEKS